MPEIKPRTKAPKQEQLTEALQGELATYEKVGLFQLSITEKTAYRYRGVLLQYQKAIHGAGPTVHTSKAFLAHLRQQGYSPSTLRVYRAALRGFHTWRGERLEFPVRVPHHAPAYIEPRLVGEILDLAKENAKDYLILRLMTDAGLRRQEVVKLRVKNVGEKALHIRGKGDKDRTVPLTEQLVAVLQPFCRGKNTDDLVVGAGEGVVYRTVKRYGRMVGRPELKPHDLRHSFATRLLEKGANLKAVQELLGHARLDTTESYLSLLPRHLRETVNLLDESSEDKLDVVGNGRANVGQTVEIAENGHTLARNAAFQEKHRADLAKAARKLLQNLRFAKRYELLMDWPIGEIVLDKDEINQIMKNDSFLGRCLLHHVQAELPQIVHLKNWGQLKVGEITDELLDCLSAIELGRIPSGKCPVCQQPQ